MGEFIGILTAGGDSPGLNAAIRGVGKAASGAHGMQIIGFRDGFRGLMQDRTVRLADLEMSGILTVGGTILGTSRDKPHRMPIGDQVMDMTSVIMDTYRRHNLDALVCLGGGGTHKNAYRLAQAGLNIVTLPKTIDNDVAMTDATIGFDTALGIATEAIDRLHSTAHSHHRIIVVEIMGHNAGWLALGAGIAGGADVILIPEIPYDIEVVAEAIRDRRRKGKGFSIVAVSEGALSKEDAAVLRQAKERQAKERKGKERKAEERVAEEGKAKARKKQTRAATSAAAKEAAAEVEKVEAKADAEEAGISMGQNTLAVSQSLERLTGLESRVTILGHLQRGGTPSAGDRLLATRLGTACAALVKEGVFGVMVAARGDSTEPVPLNEVVGKRKTVPLDHAWVRAARDIGVCLGE